MADPHAPHAEDSFACRASVLSFRRPRRADHSAFQRASPRVAPPAARRRGAGRARFAIRAHATQPDRGARPRRGKAALRNASRKTRGRGGPSGRRSRLAATDARPGRTEFPRPARRAAFPPLVRLGWRGPNIAPDQSAGPPDSFRQGGQRPAGPLQLAGHQCGRQRTSRAGRSGGRWRPVGRSARIGPHCGNHRGTGFREKSPRVAVGLHRPRRPTGFAATAAHPPFGLGGNLRPGALARHPLGCHLRGPCPLCPAPGCARCQTRQLRPLGPVEHGDRTRAGRLELRTRPGAVAGGVASRWAVGRIVIRRPADRAGQSRGRTGHTTPRASAGHGRGR